jgi:hypothetical protein
MYTGARMYPDPYLNEKNETDKNRALNLGVLITYLGIVLPVISIYKIRIGGTPGFVFLLAG